MHARIVLASASPRRRDLLREAGLDFEVRPVEVDEDLGGFADPRAAALELARRKAHAGARREVAQRPAERAWVLGADTVVALEAPGGWRLLGKPEDEREARGMLASLSGTRHAVVTGVCAVRVPDLEERAGAELTWVSMRPLSAAEVEAYAASGEWRGKAGGYAIQEQAERFVTRLEEGGLDNVVGLPVSLALALLREAGAPV
ncbi:MAG TPA: Maf family protein [Planctomycetota bacterium]|nr:Maf family protein [Planctomycetota bacterium]